MADRPLGPADRRLSVPEAPELDETTGVPYTRGANGAGGNLGPGTPVTVDEPAWRRGDWERAAAGRADGGARQTRTELAAARLGAIAAAAMPGDRLGSKDELRAQCGVSVGT